MTKSIFTSLLALVFIIAAGTMSAQTTDRFDRGERERLSPEQRAEKQTERMTKQLDLTEAQQAEVKRINEAFAKKQETHREDMRLTREAHKTALEQVLTAEQRKKAEALIAQRKAKREERGGKSDRKGRFQRGN